ncbi:MAG: ABC transporter ATP-binding protein [Nocardioidaceae bacterium]
MMNNAEGAVRIRTLHCRRGGREVLRGLTFDVPRGQVTGLLGPSGCGKTTLMRAIVGVQSNCTGEIEVLGRPAGDKVLRQRVGYVTQAPSVYADLTVRQNLQFFAAVLSTDASEVDRAIADVDLGDHADVRVDRLSGGQQSRVSLAAALLGSPELLVLDEPTVGLDPVLRRDLWAMFHRLAESGVTVLVSSHVMDEADRCERLLLMREGLLLADDKPSALRERTGSPDIEGAFLALVDKAEEEVAS